MTRVVHAGFGPCGITLLVLTLLVLTRLAFAGPYFYFKNANTSDFNIDCYFRWTVKRCERFAESPPDSWVAPCHFTETVCISYQADSNLDRKITRVEMRKSDTDPWTEVECPGLPKHRGDCVVATIEETLDCDTQASRTLKVRITNDRGLTDENKIDLRFACRPCPPPEKYAPEVFPSTPEDAFIQPQCPFPDICPTGTPGLFFTVLNLSEPTATEFVLRLKQELDWLVQPILPPVITLRAGESKLVPFAVSFPPGTVPETRNLFTLEVSSTSFPERRAAGFITAVSVPPFKVVPATGAVGNLLLVLFLSLSGLVLLARYRYRSVLSTGATARGSMTS
ncbi:MAG: hypothetical protein HY721_16615 [Planctomycetes bacterium]|nr:hypothetical protein [Planctomycetota bacterium]